MKHCVAILAFLLLGCSTLNAAPPTIVSHRGIFLGGRAVILDGFSFGLWPGNVVVGNSPIYSDCSVKVRQKIISWKNKSIGITVCQGVFRWGEVGYVFVVVPSWWFIPVISSGPYAITFGVGAGT